MNIRADSLATEGLKLRNITTNINLPSDNAVLCIKGKQITSHRKKVLKSAHQSINMRTYMKEANNWSDAQIERIWWKINDKSLAKLTDGKKLIIQKFLHGQLPCNHRNNIMYEYKPPFCTLCNQVHEDQSHVLRCPKCPSRKLIQEKFKKDLLKVLINTDTDETITRVISFTINAWLDGRPLPTLQDIAPDASRHLKQAYEFQHTIGWEQLFRGRIDISWGEMFNFKNEQQSTTRINPNKIDAETWGSKLIDTIWAFVLESWFARNEVEHNLNNKGTEISKKKLIEQITWLKAKIHPLNNHPYTHIEACSLMKLPLSNLNIMVDQIINIYEKDRLNPENYDIS
jgi:Zn finger protein HypA/HybF involved in hydrogenase expression